MLPRSFLRFRLSRTKSVERQLPRAEGLALAAESGDARFEACESFAQSGDGSGDRIP